MKVGLTLGKFAPLHCGHQLVIETAMKETDHVIVMVYDCPESTAVPLSVRTIWIRDLYPEVEVIEAWNGPAEVGNTPEIKKMQEDYILKTLSGRKITHFFNSEFYGDHVSKALGALSCTVDEGRLTYPISGTAVRENPYKYRKSISPIVYRDLVTNVVLLGAPSTGKSTLAELLAQEYRTKWMPEYGREYWDKNQNNRRLTLEQLVKVAEGHIEREDKKLLEANNYLFTDTNATTSYMFSLYYHGEVHPRLADLANSSMKRYDFVFLCEDDIPYDDTWDRSGELNRELFQKQIISDLVQRRIPFFRLTGTIQKRVAQVKKVLNNVKKFSNILDHIELKEQVEQ